jgi:hypothetical protein
MNTIKIIFPTILLIIFSSLKTSSQTTFTVDNQTAENYIVVVVTSTGVSSCSPTGTSVFNSLPVHPNSCSPTNQNSFNLAGGQIAYKLELYDVRHGASACDPQCSDGTKYNQIVAFDCNTNSYSWTSCKYSVYTTIDVDWTNSTVLISD